MKLKKNSTEKKLRGAYYTPLRLANAMVKFFSQEEIRAVLEPSCGDGVFLESLVAQGMMERISSVTAVEINSEEAEKVKNIYRDYRQVEVFQEDFFQFYQKLFSRIYSPKKVYSKLH